MEKEISSGAMLGIVLIALAAIIGIGFGVFAIAKGTANTGVADTQEQLEKVSASAYTDFDQKIVTGQQVKSCYDNFEGKPAAILIATQATKDHSDKGQYDNKVSGIKEKYGNGDLAKGINAVPYVLAYSNDKLNETADLEWKTSKDKAVDKEFFVNYNALLANEKGGYHNSDDNTKGTPYVYFDVNCFKADWGYYTKDGRVRYNNISGNLSKTGMTEYLPTSARFQAYLIKDKTGSILGAAFEQIVSN